MEKYLKMWFLFSSTFILELLETPLKVRIQVFSPRCSASSALQSQARPWLSFFSPARHWLCICRTHDCPTSAWITHAWPPDSQFARGLQPRTYPYIASLSLLRASLTDEPILGGMVLVWAVCGYWWECSWGPWLRCTACMDRAPCGSPYMVVGMPTPSIP